MVDAFIEWRNSSIPSERDVQDVNELLEKSESIVHNPEGAIAITDTDFISEKDLSPYEASVIYGVLKSANNVRTLLAFIYYSQKSSLPVISTSVLTSIADRIREVINNLSLFASVKDLYVIVPFYGYKNTLAGTIHQYELALTAINALINNPEERRISESLETSFNGSEAYYSHQALMQYGNVWQDLFRLHTVLESNHYVLEARAVAVEMSRRGYTGGRGTEDNKESSYRKLLVGKYPFGEAQQKAKKDKEVSFLKRVGVLYFMLYDYVRDSKVLTRLSHYAFDDKSPFNKERNDGNTAYSYIIHPWKFTEKGYNSDYIKEQLLKYGFAEEYYNRVYDATQNPKEKE